MAAENATAMADKIEPPFDKSDHNGQIDQMKTQTIGTLEAKTRLSEILQQVQRGARFHITKHGKPIAELRPFQEKEATPRAGFAKGLFTHVAPDFDTPLADFEDYS